MSTLPFEWLVLVGTTWHSEHDTPRENSPGVKCDWCAPTAREVVAVSPCVPTGGAGLVPLPWQLEQERPATSMVPFMCSLEVRLSDPSGFTVPGWHELQFVFCACGAGGGTPWQVPHAAWVPSTFVQRGVLLRPPPSVAPWQNDALQDALARSQTGFAPPLRASSPNVTAGAPSICERSVGTT